MGHQHGSIKINGLSGPKLLIGYLWYLSPMRVIRPKPYIGYGETPVKKRNVILAVALSLVAVGTARSQTTTDCTKTSDITVTCTTNQPPAATPPQPNVFDQWNKDRAARQAAAAARQQAAASAQQAEAACVSGGGTPYRGHCLTQEQYAEAKKAEADYSASLEAARIAKFAAQDAKDAKKDAEKEAKAAKKQAEKDAKSAKKAQQVSVAQ
jgi:hypothetical protein